MPVSAVTRSATSCGRQLAIQGKSPARGAARQRRISKRAKGAPVFSFFNETATTELYTLSLHDALPIWGAKLSGQRSLTLWGGSGRVNRRCDCQRSEEYTSEITSRGDISYAAFCLK